MNFSLSLHIWMNHRMRPGQPQQQQQTSGTMDYNDRKLSGGGNNSNVVGLADRQSPPVRGRINNSPTVAPLLPNDHQVIV